MIIYYKMVLVSTMMFQKEENGIRLQSFPSPLFSYVHLISKMQNNGNNWILGIFSNRYFFFWTKQTFNYNLNNCSKTHDNDDMWKNAELTVAILPLDH